MTLDVSLAQLEQAQLVRRLASPEEPALGAGYQFKHVLTQEAAYRSLPRRQRQEIHRQVAACYEQLFAGRLEEHAAELAYHFGEAGDDAKALAYSLLAGEAAMRVYATAEAGMHYDRAREIVLRGAAADAEQLRTLYINCGRAMELESRFADAMECYRELERLATQRSDPALELAAVLAQTKLRSYVNPFFDPVEGRTLAQRALALADQLGDRRSQAEIYWGLMNQARFDVNGLGDAVAYGERALAIARALQWKELVAYVCNDMGDIYGDAGRIADGKRVLGEAQALWRELGNLPMLADNLTSNGIWYGITGDFEAALAAIGEALTISRRIQNTWGRAYGQIARGMAYWNLAEYGQSIEDFNAGAVLAREAGFLMGEVLSRLQLAAVYLELGAPESGLREVRYLAENLREQVPQFAPVILHLLSLYCYAAGHEEEAAGYLNQVEPPNPDQSAFAFLFANPAWIQLALLQGRNQDALAYSRMHVTLMQSRGLLPSAIDGLRWRAEALRRLGHMAEAQADLHEAAALARRINQRRSLWRILPVLAELTPGEAEARALWAEARDVIQFVAGRLPDGALRASFLSLPAVRKAVDAKRNGCV